MRLSGVLLMACCAVPCWAAEQSTSKPVTSSAPSRPAEHPVSAPATAPAAADEGIENIDLISLEIQTVVTASRRAQKLTGVPYAMSVITAEDIRAAGAHNVPDALRLAAGVDVAQLSSNSWAVSPRGLHGVLAREVLVLVDGRQLFDSLYGGTLWGGWPFQIEDIARIEVIRGPGGVTWGANAVNGVINIITKDPADQLGLTLSGQGGSRGWQREYVGYGFKDDKLRLRVSGEYEGNDGSAAGGSILHGVDDDLQAGRAGVHAIFDAGPRDTLTLSGGSAVVDGGFSTPPLGTFLNPGGASARTEFVLSRWEHRIEADNRLSITGYVNDGMESPAMRSIDYNYQQLALQLNHTFKPAENHAITWGVDGRTDLLDTSNSDPFMLTERFASTAIIGVYAQDEWRFAPRWTLTLGARVDYEFYGGFQPSGRAALSYDLSETSLLYGAVSRAFQMPPLGSRFLNVPTLDGLTYVTSDRDVDAEPLVAYELGYRGRPLERLHAGAAVFWHEYDKLTVLGLHPGPPGLVRYNFMNGGGASLYGVELDAKYDLTADLCLLGNYTYQQIDAEDNYSIRDTDYMSPPRHKFMVGARYRLTEALRLSAHLYYVDAAHSRNSAMPLLTVASPPYFRLDLRAEYEFWKDRAFLAFGVRNLLDSNHLEGTSLFQTTTEVPRLVYAELRFTMR